jgi:hypothetical protein
MSGADQGLVLAQRSDGPGISLDKCAEVGLGYERRTVMRDWIVFFVLYVVVLGLFRALGGLRSAADAFRMWGKASTAIRDDPRSS